MVRETLNTQEPNGPLGPPNGWHESEQDLLAILDATLADYQADADRVYLTGSPGIDQLLTTPLMTREELEEIFHVQEGEHALDLRYDPGEADISLLVADPLDHADEATDAGAADIGQARKIHQNSGLFFI